jgi:hypothetical protein
MTDEQERSHCEQALIQLVQGNISSVDLLMRERDAADQAGYERGRAEQSEHTASALELGDKAGYERGRAEGDRLDAAARAYLKAKNSAGANEVLARETELIAALSDQPETSEDKS